MENNQQNKGKFKWAEGIVKLTDTAIKIPGTNFSFGIDPIIGLIPIAGETVTLAISLLMVLGFAREGANASILFRMLGNVLVDYVVGSIPVVGDLFDFAFKANKKNLQLAEKHLTETDKNPKGLAVVIMVLLLIMLILLVLAGYLSFKIIEWLFV